MPYALIAEPTVEDTTVPAAAELGGALVPYSPLGVAS
jgi:hypothetical protein